MTFHDRKFASLKAELERKGVILPGATAMLPRQEMKRANGSVGWGDIVFDQALMALDAQPTLITAPNAGVPSIFTTYVDPKVIEVILTPNNAVKIYGETRKGDWVTDTTLFPMIEYTGEVSSYSDFVRNGRAGGNAQWEPRQSYLVQTFTEWGDREAERMAAGRIDWVSTLNRASMIVLDKFQNQSYFYGIANIVNYGALNDPSLSAALTPTTKTAGGTSWSVALAQEILADVQKMFAQLQIQTGSNLEMDTPMVLALHSVSEVYLANTNTFGVVSAIELIKKAFPGLRVQQAPQFLSGTTYSCQLKLDSIQGQGVIECGYNEKLRAHRVIYDDSSVRQKKTCGTWGTLLYMPIGIVSMSAI